MNHSIDHAQSIHAAIYALRKPILDKIKNMTVSKLLLRNATDHPHEIALFSFPHQDYQSPPASTSWQDLHQQAMQLASYFLHLNIQNQTVLIMSRNRPEHFIADLATLYTQNTPCSIYTTLTAQQISTIINITHASTIIVDDLPMYQQARKALRLSKKKPQIICMERPKSLFKHTVTWQTAMHIGSTNLPSFQKSILYNIRHSNPKDPACIIFTSGTTGTPKGAILSHENVLFSAAGVEAVGTSHIPNAKLLSYLPLAHVFERVVGYYGGIFSRHRLYCIWSVEDLKEALPIVRPNIFVGVPRVYEKIEEGLLSKISHSPLNWLFQQALANGSTRNQFLQKNQTPPWTTRLKHYLFHQLFLHKVRRAIGLDQCQLCLSGAAPLDPKIIDFFASLNLDIVEGYGLTENSAPATVSWNDALTHNMRHLFSQYHIPFPYPITRQFGRVGYPMPGTKIRIGSCSLIQVYGPHIFQGYLNDARNTKASLDKKWLKTGDIGCVHSTGEIEIVGRKKDIIVLSNGKNIAPRKIESLLLRHPLIAHVCLSGDGKAYATVVICLRHDGGEIRYAKSHHIPHASREKMATHPLVIQTIQSHIDRVNQNFCRPEQIKYFHLTSDIWSPDTGELTPTLKLKRPFVLQKYATHIDSIYADHHPSQHLKKS